ncbi:Clp1/GlmU family protein [Microvirga sp. G4-2]|uniref:Clp1/GlmU family protein n=1 Tax=Microvirga sp. G4-2 TaxID=3434467 RepID=UPI00404436BC
MRSLSDLHVPREWHEAAQRLERDDIRTIGVIGRTDCGKSMLVHYLFTSATQTGRDAALIDTDLGQKMIGPPACVTMSDAQGLALVFVGSTDPVFGWKPLLEGTRRLLSVTDAAIIIVNTSGLLSGPGRRLKAAKLQVIQPDLLIALGDAPELEPIISERPDIPVLRLPSSPYARRKTDGERRAGRRRAFHQYFEDAAILSLDPSLLLEAPPAIPPERRLLVGLRNALGNDLGLGLMSGARDNEAIEVLTPVRRAGIQSIVPGSLALDETYSETRLKMEGQGWPGTRSLL